MAADDEHAHDIPTDSDGRPLPLTRKQKLEALAERAKIEFPGMNVRYELPGWEPQKGIRNPNRFWRGGGYI